MIPASAPPVLGPPPRYFALRIALLFCAPLIVNGFAMPYFPVWLSSLSMSDFEIGVVLAVPMFIRVITAPLAGVLADRLGERTIVLIWSGCFSLGLAFVLFFAKDFWPVLVIYALQSAAYSPYLPIVEAIALSGVRRWGFDYAQMRVWGSIAFIGATMLGGWMIGFLGGAMVLPAMAVGFGLTVAMACAAPRIGRPRRPSPITAITEAPPQSLRQPDLQLLLIGVTLVNSSHAMLFAFSAIYWQQIGYSGTQIGALWSAGVAAEVLMFFFAKAITRRFSVWAMIFSGCLLAVVRWLIFPLDLGFSGYFVLQCFHAFTYAIMHTGMQHKLVERVAEEQEASAQGLYFFYTGIFTAIFTFMSGYFYAWFGVTGFYSMSVVALFGSCFAFAGWYLQPHRLGSGGKTSEAS
ncbi:MFS transporter [Sinorhizobium americanum]|uniref:PPP family 3-phenylpropionic acid transporter n=1 Tax=Sinorhizobium americanum TaxID=194963 RepID=A0A4R2BN88_9HYPH|nr:MFS transporter [Sinorhizobium americanum]OAP37577.1 3-phenylpropionic acid transporter [Sinorhizobium americanum]TCN28918.1 PPP family 3-phenylpropionic acid transporter [Sinorhizobium americanum]